MSRASSARTAGRNRHEHRAPADCPVCNEHLFVTRLGCESCGTELAGLFAPCSFCALDQKDLDLLRVFLVSRGNMREVEKHLGVSYPTARQRFADVLDRLGLSESGEAEAPDTGGRGQDTSLGAPPAGTASDLAPQSRDEILAAVAAGRLTPGEAQLLLSS